MMPRARCTSDSLKNSEKPQVFIRMSTTFTFAQKKLHFVAEHQNISFAVRVVEEKLLLKVDSVLPAGGLSVVMLL